MPHVTALKPDRAERYVVVELDGASWRRIPVDAAVRAGLGIDVELGRPQLRQLRRELRRAEALDTATRALRHRDRSSSALRARLRDAGIAPAACEDALDTLESAGIVDDDRFAVARASALAARGSGDALIRADLSSAGVPDGVVVAALAALEPERERATGLVAARGESVATARWLARRGFGSDAIEAALPSLVAGDA
jgi:SOS response regulatory protein OraA/RecX